MLKYCRKLLLAAVLTLCTSSASATSACKDPEGCLDAWAVFILVLHELRLEHCPPLSSLSDEEKIF